MWAGRRGGVPTSASSLPVLRFDRLLLAELLSASERSRGVPWVSRSIRPSFANRSTSRSGKTWWQNSKRVITPETRDGGGGNVGGRGGEEEACRRRVQPPAVGPRRVASRTVARLVEHAEHVAHLRRRQVEAELAEEGAELEVAEHPRLVGVGRVEEVLHSRQGDLALDAQSLNPHDHALLGALLPSQSEIVAND